MRIRGFTLIELVITVAVLAVILVSVAPGIAEYMTDFRVRVVTDQFREGLMRAKMEAIKRNTRVDFVPDGTGWKVEIPAVGETPAQTITARKALDSEAKLTITPTLDRVGFNGAGWTSGGVDFRADVTRAGGTCKADAGTVRCLRVTVTGAGSIRVCDAAVSGTVQGCG